MAKTDNLAEFLTGIADVIREVKGTSDLINPQNFRSEIEGFSAEQPQLYAPTIKLADSYLNITNNANNGSFVEYFDVYVNGSKQEGSVTGTATQFIWSDYVGEPGTITVTARGTYFIDSNLSNEVSIGADLIGGLYGTDGSFTPWSRLINDGVITMDGANISDVNTSIAGDLIIPSNRGITGLGNYAFQNCSSLASVVLPNGLTSIGIYAFDNCVNLASVTLPDGLTNIGNYAFYSCKTLSSIIIPDSVTNIGKLVFGYCSTLSNISVNTNNTTYQSIDGSLYSKDGKTLIQYAAGKTDTSFTAPSSVTTIGECAFMYCLKLTEVTLGDNVTNIAKWAFRTCNNLTKITINSQNITINNDSLTIPKEITIYGHAGSGAETYATLRGNTFVPFVVIHRGSCGYDGDDVRWELNATTGSLVISGSGQIDTYSEGTTPWYQYATLIKTAIIGNGIEYISKYTLYGCSNLEELTIPFIGDWYDSTEKTHRALGWIFGESSYIGGESTQQYNKSNGSRYRVTYYIPATLKTVWVTGGDIFSRVFYNCKNLQYVITPDTATQIGEGAFYNCQSLTDVVISRKIELIDEEAFYNCSSLVTIDTGYGVKTIEYCAFEDCTSLEEVYIGRNVTAIGDYAFAGCISLKYIYYARTSTYWKQIEFGDGWDEDTGDYEVII